MGGQVELRHVSGFVAVAEELHFGRAARRLHMSQPAVSRLVRQLETELGVSLLQRSTRRVNLTPAGTAFLQEARRGLASFQAAARRAHQAGSAPPTALRIGFSECTEEWLPAVLRAISRQEPAAHLEVRDVDRDSQVRLLIQGEIDLAIRRAPVDEAEIETELLFSEPMMVVMPALHRLAAAEKLRLDQLEAWPWVVMPASSGHAPLLSAASAGGFFLRAAEEVYSLSSMLVLVSAGAGLALVPRSVAHRFSSEDVVARGLEAPAPTLPVIIAWRRNDARSSVRQFLDAIRGAVRSPDAMPSPQERRVDARSGGPGGVGSL